MEYTESPPDIERTRALPKSRLIDQINEHEASVMEEYPLTAGERLQVAGLFDHERAAAAAYLRHETSSHNNASAVLESLRRVILRQARERKGQGYRGPAGMRPVPVPGG